MTAHFSNRTEVSEDKRRLRMACRQALWDGRAAYLAGNAANPHTFYYIDLQSEATLLNSRWTMGWLIELHKARERAEAGARCGA
jgi:hypothetical protein